MYWKARISAIALALFVSGTVMATSVTPPAPGGAAAVWGTPPVGYVTTDGNLVLGGTCVASINATNITGGNLAVARITNAAATVGPSIGGNIPVAAITNAAATLGPSVGGNIPVAAITNAAATVGPSIGGNLALATITNAMAAAGILTAGTITLTGTHTNDATTGKILIQNTLASATTLTGWWSKTAGGAASTVALGAFTAGTNTTLLTATNSSTVVFTGHTDGSAVLDVLIGGATGGPTTNYFNVVQRDGAIKSSSAMVFPGP